MRLWANLAGMLLVVVLLCLGVKIGIDIYTHHGEVIMVPDVKRKQFADAEHILAANGLGVVVSDTGYVKTLPPDCILEQSPEPGRGVKSGRVIYVVINSSHSPMLTIPDIVDNMDDSVVYTEPEDYFDEFGDSLAEPMPADGVYYTEPEQEGEVDEFEVVTGPE